MFLRQAGEVDRIGRLAVKRLVGPVGVVEVEIDPQTGLGGRDRVVGFQINLLVLHAAPQALDEDVVAPAALAIHADRDLVVLEHLREVQAGELAALIGVEDFRLAVAGDGFLKRIDAEIRGQRIGEPPGEHAAAGPIDDRHEIDEAPAHRDVGDIRGPDLVGPVDLQVPEQVRIDGMGRMAPAGIGLPVQRLDTHLLHQRADVLAANHMAFPPEHVAQHPAAGKGILQVQFVDPAHQRQICRRGRRRRVVRRRAGQPEGVRIAGQPAGRGCGRSSSCAQQARLGERLF